MAIIEPWPWLYYWNDLTGFYIRQESLGEPFSSILYNNLWDLYVIEQEEIYYWGA